MALGTPWWRCGTSGAEGGSAGQAWSVGMIHSSLMEVWRGRVTM
jgi:hypothetical protein